MPAPQISTIQDILNRLNGTETGDPWAVVPGLFAMTAVEASPGSINFNPASGVVVKIFKNNVTGELRTYLAKVLDGDGRNL